jgi:hypothetical protein
MVKEMEWKPVSERPEWDMQPGRQFIRIEGLRHHSGVNWHRVYFGIAFIRKPGAIDELHGYRDTDIIQLCDEGDMDIATVEVTHWAPAKFHFSANEKSCEFSKVVMELANSSQSEATSRLRQMAKAAIEERSDG